MICQICCKEIDGFYHRFVCDTPGIDEELYTHGGDCYNIFCGKAVIEVDQTLNDLKLMEKIDWHCDEREEYRRIIEEEKISDRFEILDL